MISVRHDEDAVTSGRTIQDSDHRVHYISGELLHGLSTTGWVKEHPWTKKQVFQWATVGNEKHLLIIDLAGLGPC